MACGGCGSDKTYTLQLINKEQDNDTTVTLTFANLEPLTWKSGDSSKVFIPIEGVMEGKKLSYITLPDEKVVKFTTRIRQPISPYKARLRGLKTGDFIEVSEPGGSFELRREERPAMLLSNGVGIAGIRSLVKAFEADDSGVMAMTQINVDHTGALYAEEFDGIEQAHGGFKSIYVNHRKAFYEQMAFASQDLMMVTGFIPYFYVVGTEDFILDVTAHLMSVGFDEADIITDGLSGGGCGCGGSGGCGCG